jgi:hypothetical protein
MKCLDLTKDEVADAIGLDVFTGVEFVKMEFELAEVDDE